MKVWKRNAVVAAIVLFVCVAVYLNWSYQSGETADAGKTLGEAALVNGQTSDPLVGGTAASPDPASLRLARGRDHRRELFRLGPSEPAAGAGQRPGDPPGFHRQ